MMEVVGNVLHYTDSPSDISVITVAWCGHREADLMSALLICLQQSALLPCLVPFSGQHCSTCPRVLPHTCATLPLRAFSCKRPAGNGGALTPLETASQPTMDINWRINTPASLLLKMQRRITLKHVLYPVS